MKDVSDEIELKNGRANPWGWSSHDIYHKGGKIGTLYCGFPEIKHPHYQGEVVRVNEKTKRLVVWWDEISPPECPSVP